MRVLLSANITLAMLHVERADISETMLIVAAMVLSRVSCVSAYERMRVCLCVRNCKSVDLPAKIRSKFFNHSKVGKRPVKTTSINSLDKGTCPQYFTWGIPIGKFPRRLTFCSVSYGQDRQE